MKAEKERVHRLHQAILSDQTPEETLWQTIIAFQGRPFATCSGLPFTYQVKKNRQGLYSGELMINRKEGSKTLTRSSVVLAYHRVRREMTFSEDRLIPGCFKGPKAIGQIFGISYIYSIFYTFELIEVPEKYKSIMQKGDEASYGKI